MSNKIISGIGWTTLSSIIRNLVSLLQIAILTRFLDKTDFGIVAIANLFVGFTTMFLDMGISAGILHRHSITDKEYSSLFWLNIFFGTFLTLLLYILAPYITAQYNSPDLTNIVRLISFTLFFSSLGNQQRTFCQKNTYFKRLSIIEIFGYITAFTIAVLSVINGRGVYSIAYSTLAGSIVLNITHLIFALLKDNRFSFHFSIKETIPFLKIGIYQVGSSILDFFTRELDILIISNTIGLHFLGVYDIAKRVPTALFAFILPIVNRVFPPILAAVNNEINILKKTYITLAKLMSWFSFPMYMLVAAISPTILTIVFGAEYIEGVAIMIIFSIKYAFSGTNTICGALQVATGRTDIGLKWTIYSILSTALVYTISSQWGIITFLTSMLMLIIINVIMLWLIQFKPMTDISLKEYISIFFIPLVICILLSSIIYVVYNSPSIVYAICSSLIYMILYLILLINSKDGLSIVSMLGTLKLPNYINHFVNKLRLIS